MKASSYLTIGKIFIIWSVLGIAIGFCQIVPFAFVDFPCFYDMTIKEEIFYDTRIAYCISIWPRSAVSGGGIYDVGTTNLDEVKVGELDLSRNEGTIFIDGNPLNAGETYKTTHWEFSISFWVLLTSRFEINNEGLITSTESVPKADALYVTGDVYEGWTINPLGPVILGVGIWLLRKGKKELKRESSESPDQRLNN